MGNETRKRTTHIMVRVSPDEKEAIIKAAEKCDLKAPTYLRELGLGYEPKSTVDAQAFEKLAQLHGDIGRVGGLLKMWLSDNSKAGFGRHLNIPELIDRLIELQKEIGEKAKKL
ncbi:conjugal transfer protein TraJ [Escherichia coli]|nr:conjugal transfer protein TraJ [Escherichia coli]